MIKEVHRNFQWILVKQNDWKQIKGKAKLIFFLCAFDLPDSFLTFLIICISLCAVKGIGRREKKRKRRVFRGGWGVWLKEEKARVFSQYPWVESWAADLTVIGCLHQGQDNSWRKTRRSDYQCLISGVQSLFYHLSISVPSRLLAT